MSFSDLESCLVWVVGVEHSQQPRTHLSLEEAPNSQLVRYGISGGESGPQCLPYPYLTHPTAAADLQRLEQNDLCVKQEGCLLVGGRPNSRVAIAE